jgi:hypothetical protein
MNLICVRVRDRGKEAPWGSGPTHPVVRDIRIPPVCPRCGGPRGVPVTTHQYEDGEHYWVDTWTNQCGHLDRYTDVIAEAHGEA